MSLRARLLLVIVLVNVGVLGIVQITTQILQAPARQEERRSYQRILEHQYQRAFAAAYEVVGTEELEAEKEDFRVGFIQKGCEVAELQAKLDAVKGYANHKSECDSWYTYSGGIDGRCNCGFAEAIGEQE